MRKLENRRMGSWVFAMAIAIGIACSASAGIVTWREPANALATDDYKVSVNGVALDVCRAPGSGGEKPPADHIGSKPYSFARFAGDCDAEIEISSTQSLERVRILPLARRIAFSRPARNAMRFTARPPFQLVIEPNGRNGALALFADPPESDPPEEGAPGVVWFGPGRHKREIIRLKDGETLYLAPGAWVEGAVAAKGANIAIRGRGVLDGSSWKWQKGPYGHMVQLLECKNATVKDVALVSAWTWCLVAIASDNTRIDNVKILGGRVINDDGIDICNSVDTKISNCFVRSQDDAIAIKCLAGYKAGGIERGCERLEVRNCILWSDAANVFRIGYESSGEAFRDFTFRDIDVLHHAQPKSPPPAFWSHSFICLQPSNGKSMNKLLFENIRIDTQEKGDSLLRAEPMICGCEKKYTEPGMLSDCTFRNISISGKTTPDSPSIYIKGADANHAVRNLVFENVSGYGAVTIKPFAENIRGLTPTK